MCVSSRCVYLNDKTKMKFKINHVDISYFSVNESSTKPKYFFVVVKVFNAQRITGIWIINGLLMRFDSFWKFSNAQQRLQSRTLHKSKYPR